MSGDNNSASVVENAASVDENCASVEKKMVELRSSDGEHFVVEEKVAVVSVTLRNVVDDGCGDSVVPMPNVTGKTLAKVIEYCKHHAGEDEGDETVKANRKKELDEFDAEFVKVERDVLFDLILAANYMNVKGLLALMCQTIANMIKDMTVEEVRGLFSVTNDFTPEEEDKIRNENLWAFE